MIEIFTEGLKTVLAILFLVLAVAGYVGIIFLVGYIIQLNVPIGIILFIFLIGLAMKSL